MQAPELHPKHPYLIRVPDGSSPDRFRHRHSLKLREPDHSNRDSHHRQPPHFSQRPTRLTDPQAPQTHKTHKNHQPQKPN